jgi:hypothetical protein
MPRLKPLRGLSLEFALCETSGGFYTRVSKHGVMGKALNSTLTTACVVETRRTRSFAQQNSILNTACGLRPTPGE